MSFLVEFDLPDKLYSIEFRQQITTIFQRFTPGKKRIVSLLKDFGHRYFLVTKTFSGAQRRTKNVVFGGIWGTNMSFWVEFGEIQYVVLDGILPKIKN